MNWPNVVEIEVNRHCNRKCSYCPTSLSKGPNKAEMMTVELYHRVIEMLHQIEFSGRLSFHFYNEPLLRKDLEELVAWARAKLPFAFFVLYTNGDLLNQLRYEKLFEAGIDRFKVTRHDWEDFPQRPFQMVQFPDNFAVSGRGGSISQEEHSLDLHCYAPSEMLIVTLNGDVVLCHEDAERKYIMGNLQSQTLSEVWYSNEFKNIRKQLISQKRCSGPAICQKCNSTLYPVPGASI